MDELKGLLLQVFGSADLMDNLETAVGLKLMITTPAGETIYREVFHEVIDKIEE
ncbi:hypothetical protein [Bacillus sp. AG4(2022)]|uniref:hypothetical protein n=1 Tax=Bacillus sp. AG4(2022) TaxID=2962594 RepID=UPI002881D9E9|nr:hypothetical protein [Bacillus sp. AG4(2022)]MDT0160366.1 hypothetical protein [Bacillus sp. AG4(2022)]